MCVGDKGIKSEVKGMPDVFWGSEEILKKQQSKRFAMLSKITKNTSNLCNLHKRMAVHPIYVECRTHLQLVCISNLQWQRGELLRSLACWTDCKWRFCYHKSKVFEKEQLRG